jgi:hypothetical protein
MQKTERTEQLVECLREIASNAPPQWIHMCVNSDLQDKYCFPGGWFYWYLGVWNARQPNGTYPVLRTEEAVIDYEKTIKNGKEGK